MRAKRLLAVGSLLLLSTTAMYAAIDPITVFPEPASFTTRLNTLPNPFLSWEGTAVTPVDWPKRVTQLGQIMGYYEQGFLPATAGITVSLALTKAQSSYTTASGQGTASVTVYKDGVAAVHQIHISFFLPDPAKFPPPAEGYPVVLNTALSVGNFSNLATTYGIATVGITVTDIDSGDNETGSYKANNRAGVVNDVFNTLAMMPDASRNLYSMGTGPYGDVLNGQILPPYILNPGNPDAPSLMVCQAWGIGRIIDAIEADHALPAIQRSLNLDPKKIALSGISRLGKLTLVAGAFDSRIAVVNPVSSGSGGVTIDRFTSVDVNQQQSLGLAPSFGYAYPINKTFYYVKINDKSPFDNTYAADAVLPAEALIDPNGRLDGGTTPSSAFQTFHDFNDFTANLKVAVGQTNPLGSGANATSTTGVGHGDNIKPGYAVIDFGRQTSGAEANQNEGTQNFCDVRWAYGCWMNPRFRQWPVPADLFKVDIVKRVNRGEYGWFNTEPFDQHFLLGMVAPRALLVQDGYLSNNTNPEAMYFSYLAAREVYRFLGVPEKIGINMHLINHANPLAEIMELGEFMLAVFSNQPLDPKFHVSSFPINDPRSLYDYARLDWAAPGYRPLARQVADLHLTEADRPSASVRAKTDDQVEPTASMGGFVLNRRTNMITQQATLTNVTGLTVTGPILFVTGGLSSTTTLLNATGSSGGSPSILVSNGNLAPGASVSVTLQFAVPTSGGITYTPGTISGP